MLIIFSAQLCLECRRWRNGLAGLERQLPSLCPGSCPAWAPMSAPQRLALSRAPLQAQPGLVQTLIVCHGALSNHAHLLLRKLRLQCHPAEQSMWTTPQSCSPLRAKGSSQQLRCGLVAWLLFGLHHMLCHDKIMPAQAWPGRLLELDFSFCVSLQQAGCSDLLTVQKLKFAHH